MKPATQRIRTTSTLASPTFFAVSFVQTAKFPADANRQFGITGGSIAIFNFPDQTDCYVSEWKCESVIFEPNIWLGAFIPLFDRPFEGAAQNDFWMLSIPTWLIPATIGCAWILTHRRRSRNQASTI